MIAAQAGLRLGPVVLDTLLKHYFDRFKDKTKRKRQTRDSAVATTLRQDDILYDEAFNIVKDFLEESTYYTVEDVQAFANVKTPSPPWVHVVRLVIPLSSCNDAAVLLTRALGGEQAAHRMVGGVKWWQVRGIDGVDAQWITAKKDWRDAKKRHKMQQSPGKPTPTSPAADSKDDALPEYEQEMDEMRCILYIHGGGYFFGSVDQERYSIQRHARKINGRVLAINYRLSPQYPFPCALQDALTAYLFLIRPPPGAAHRAVKPAHIVIMGDSAGGGISLSLLQIIRDTGLPVPAGGVLISPWCDLTHSFPSIHTNTATDIIPSCGLSLQKPSTLWPPPDAEFSNNVHASLRSRIRQTLHMDEASSPSSVIHERRSSNVSITGHPMPVDVGATTSVPAGGTSSNQTISLSLEDGETLEIHDQIHMYTQNSLLTHPLVSPALSYLGGLPPLFFIASDKEVLRDEIIYTAHKAAHPDNFPASDDARAMYPPLVGIETRYEPTQVHLQVYDDAAHILPVLFAFTTPAKYCYRAMATFCKHVTGVASPPVHSPIMPSFPQTQAFPTSPETSTVNDNISSDDDNSGAWNRAEPTPSGNDAHPAPIALTRRGSSFKNSLSSFSSNVSRMTLAMRRESGLGLSIASSSDSENSSRPTGDVIPGLPPLPHSESGFSTHSTSSDVGGPDPRLVTSSPPPVLKHGERTAGDGVVYSETPDFPSWKTNMIRERVSIHGVIRPLEANSELDCFTVPNECVGKLNELAIRRYLGGREKFNTKFSSAIKTIEKHRRSNVERANKDTHRSLTQLQATINQHEDNGKSRWKELKEHVLASSGEKRTWVWALDGDERPPPSSIASRRDTEEARRLARIADLSVMREEERFSANNLWSAMIDFLSVKPEKNDRKGVEETSTSKTLPKPTRKSTFSRIFT